ncbi:hypothetical protein COB64_03400 [Candidatus Wolfebacteria bacterium]|nr:MAG: hypothetical protein COB64_03400 [Candidatus Wolfebacteria bacterium]
MKKLILKITVLLVISFFGNISDVKSQSFEDMFKDETEESKESEEIESINVNNYLDQVQISMLEEYDQRWSEDSSKTYKEYNTQLVKRWKVLNKKQKDECLTKVQANSEKSKLFVVFGRSRNDCIHNLNKAAAKHRTDKKELIDSLQISSLKVAEAEKGGKTRALAKAAIKNFIEGEKIDADNEYKASMRRIATLRKSMGVELQELNSKSKMESEKTGDMVCYNVKIF